MSLKQQIISDLTSSMKAQDAPRTSTLRMVKAALVNREIEKGGELDDEEMLKKADGKNLPIKRKLRSKLSKPICRRQPHAKRSRVQLPRQYLKPAPAR